MKQFLLIFIAFISLLTDLYSADWNEINLANFIKSKIDIPEKYRLSGIQSDLFFGFKQNDGKTSLLRYCGRPELMDILYTQLNNKEIFDSINGEIEYYLLNIRVNSSCKASEPKSKERQDSIYLPKDVFFNALRRNYIITVDLDYCENVPKIYANALKKCSEWDYKQKYVNIDSLKLFQAKTLGDIQTCIHIESRGIINKDYDLVLNKDSSIILRKVSFNTADTSIYFVKESFYESLIFYRRHDLEYYFRQFRDFPSKPEESINASNGIRYKIVYYNDGKFREYEYGNPCQLAEQSGISLFNKLCILIANFKELFEIR